MLFLMPARCRYCGRPWQPRAGEDADRSYCRACSAARSAEALRNRRFDQLVFDHGERDRSELNARVDKLFEPFFRFIRESMTAGKEPFVEVLAVFRHESGYRPGTGGRS